MQNTIFEDLLQQVGRGLSSQLIQETRKFYEQEEQLLRQLYNADKQHVTNEIEKLLYQYQRMLIFMYSDSALQHLLKNLNLILSCQYSFNYFNDDLKCQLASFKYLLVFLTEIPYVSQLITEFDRILNNQCLDTFIARRVMKLMVVEKLRDHYYTKVYENRNINLNYYTKQTREEQEKLPNKKQDYSNLKFSFKKEVKIQTPQPYYQPYQTSYQTFQPGQQTPQLYISQPPPAYWPQQQGPKPPQSMYSVPFPPSATYTPMVPPMAFPTTPPIAPPMNYPMGLPMNYPMGPPQNYSMAPSMNYPQTPPMTPLMNPPMYLFQDQQLNVTYCPIPPQAAYQEPQQQSIQTFDPDIIKNPMTDSIYQETHSNQSNAKQEITINQQSDRYEVPLQQKPSQSDVKQEVPTFLQPPQQQFDNDAYQASILSQNLENLPLEPKEEESEIEKLLLKQFKQNVEIYDSRKKQPIQIAATRLQKQVSSITESNHDILALQILTDFLNDKMQKVNWASRRKEMQQYFDF